MELTGGQKAMGHRVVPQKTLGAPVSIVSPGRHTNSFVRSSLTDVMRLLTARLNNALQKSNAYWFQNLIQRILE